MERKREKKSGKILILVLLAVIIAFGGLVALLYPKNAIARGVSVDGVNVGNMTVEEAQQALETVNLDSQNIVITDVSGAKTEFLGSEIELKKDAQKTAETAYLIGRNQGVLENFFTRLSVFVSKMDIPYSYNCSEEKLAELLYNFGVSVNGEQKNFVLEFDENYVTVKKGQKGQSRDVGDLLLATLKAFAEEKFEVGVELKSTEPPVPNAQNVYDEICVEAKDAEYRIVDGRLEILPEVVGRTVSKEEIEDNIEKLANGDSITIKIATVEPKITEKSIKTDLFGYALGSYSSSYATSSANRASNVELAARRIDALVLMPGEEFSYNKAVGNRTAANGFKEAPVYANGETVEGMGGGICQVSSTLYSAALYADLEITARRNHSMTVSYVPKGQDATVSYGSIDFKFKNNTKNSIMISATTGGKRLNISILSAKPEVAKTVKIINTVTNTKNPTVEETEKEDMKRGTRKIISNGKTGYTVATTREVYENGKKIKSEKMSSSTYKMVPTKVAVGPAVEKASTEAEGVLDNETASDDEKSSDSKNENEEKTENTEEEIFL